MSFEYRDVWEFWYESQLQEVTNHRIRYSEERPSLVDANPFDPEADADVLRGAMKGFGTSEDEISEILTKRTAAQRMQIREKYQQIHGRDLIKDLKSELGGAFEKIILALMKPRSLLLAESIKNATKGLGTDENAVMEILCSRDDESIESIKKTFEEEYGISLEEVICKEASGDFEKLIMSILAVCRNDDTDPSSVAEELNAEDIEESTIRRIITAYTFPFLKTAFAEYSELSGQQFLDLVEQKCSGDSAKAMKVIYECTKSRTEFYARQLQEAMAGFGTDDTALIRIIISRCEIDLGTIIEKYAEIYDGKTVQEELEKEVSGDYGKALLALVNS